MKINLNQIKTGLIHNNTVFRKSLIKSEENKRKIATMNYAWLEKGNELEAHSHPDGEEYYFFLEGEGEILIDENWIPVAKDDFVTIPANATHSLRSNTKKIVFITIRTVLP